ncbi:MAG: cell division protein FtsW [Candidatus Campbellbacteria bacterium]
MKKKVDKPFLFIIIALVSLGFFAFMSASLGLLARESVDTVGQVVNQAVAIVIGIAALAVAMRLSPEFWNKYAFYLFLAAIVATFLVFVPGLGFEHAGARRWIDVGIGPSIQPAEFLKFAFILYYAAWCAAVQRKIHTLSYSIVPLLVLLAVCAVPLILQPDYGTLIIIGATGFAMLIAAGASWKHTGALALAGIAFVALVGTTVPYIQDRLVTFLDPGRDPQGAGYQIQQSLIAIGSGHITGRGFGQSVQKFNFLPEPVGDSIFAVFAEEWGFVGAVALIAMFIAFLSRGYRIAIRAPKTFSRIVVVGFITSITVQSFMNMGSMLGVMPLTGDPLAFVSQGGTAIVMTLLAVGVVLSVSRTIPAQA